MDDPRLTPARPEVAAKYLEGKVKAARFVEGEVFEVTEAIAPLRRTPASDAELMTQALKGERVTIYDRNGEGWAWGQLDSDGYVGWLPDGALAKACRAADAQGHRALDVCLSRSLDQAAAGRAPCRWAQRSRSCARKARSPSPRAGSLPAAAASRTARRKGSGFRRGRRTLRRHALSVGRQERVRHRLLGPGAGVADGGRHRLSARQRHAARRTRPRAERRGVKASRARRSDLLERPCRDRARCRHHRACQCASHGDRDREHERGDRADQGGRQRDCGDQAA